MALVDPLYFFAAKHRRIVLLAAELRYINRRVDTDFDGPMHVDFSFKMFRDNAWATFVDA